jgi:Fe-S oxidoreductase
MEDFLRYYDHFVLPFALGVLVLFGVIAYKYVRWFSRLPEQDRDLVRGRLLSRRTLGAVGETVCESLLHRKIWRVNPVLGYMHTSLALGWFLLIVVGWVESSMHFDAAIMPPYTHVFFKFFGPTAVETTTGRLLGFVMDALLLFVLSGVLLAWVKRLRSQVTGMRRTTRHTLWDRFAMTALWFVFPARLIAESATSGIDGGHTFLTGAVGEWMLEMFGIGRLYLINAGAWWFYSLVLGVFFVAMPFSRYMHIFTEVPLIFLRRWGVRAGEEQNAGDNFQVEACSRCGVCLDPCAMQSAAGVKTVQAAYYLRDRRYHRLTREVAENCLMCGRCEARCPVGIEVAALRLQSRRKFNDVPAEGRYDYLDGTPNVGFAGQNLAARRRPHAADGTRDARLSTADGSLHCSSLRSPRTGYFAGCMTLLSPKILRSMEAVFAAGGDDVWWADRDGGVCCGRPLKLAGETSAARKMMSFNEELFRKSGITTLVTSCPICLRVFREDYALKGIEVLHHSEYIARLMDEGILTPAPSGEVYTYHDPCELGRGCGVYDAPRRVVGALGELRESRQSSVDSPCCGGSLANVALDDEARNRITRALTDELEATGASAIVTSCPLCRTTIAAATSLPVMDIAEALAARINH